MALTIQAVKDAGKTIELSDGSRWIVGIDSYKSSIWLWNDKVEVSPGKLTNLTRKQSVSAQRA